ncbi:MAG: hypothetical protein J5968_02010 [Oscillospiraceae bacterium]|nr:hypothetical protein [Oscillospiraceae bacterium]
MSCSCGGAAKSRKNQQNSAQNRTRPTCRCQSGKSNQNSFWPDFAYLPRQSNSANGCNLSANNSRSCCCSR